ncbi:MAG: DMT family transporter [Granulosicoccaceae bacterium]
MSRSRQDRRTGWLLAASGMLLVSTDAVFVRAAGTGAVELAWLVALFCLPLCLWLNWRFEVLRPLQALRAHPVVLTVLALLVVLTQLCFFAAVEHTQIANVVAIVAAGPLFVALGAGVFLGERTSPRVWAAIAISGLGIALIVAPSLGSAHMVGDLLALVTIIGFSATLLLLRSYPELSRFLVFSASAALLLVLGLPWVEPLEQPLSAWLCAAAMGLVFNTGGRVLYANAPRFAPSSEVALFNPVETVAATLWGVLFFAEVPSLQVFIGAVVVLLGLVLGTLRRP